MEGLFEQKTGWHTDGVATFYDNTKFKAVHIERGGLWDSLKNRMRN